MTVARAVSALTLAAARARVAAAAVGHDAARTRQVDVVGDCRQVRVVLLQQRPYGVLVIMQRSTFPSARPPIRPLSYPPDLWTFKRGYKDAQKVWKLHVNKISLTLTQRL